jgi:hypothetical protein
MNAQSFGRKALFGTFDEAILNIVKGLGTFTLSTKLFMEQVKVIYKQNGFVATGLNAQIKVAMKPVSFSVAL